MSRAWLLAAGCLQPRPCFAGPDDLVPRVTSMDSTSTFSEPRTAATTTTAFPRLLDGAAFVAYGPDGRRRRRGCWSKKQREKRSIVAA